MSDGYGSYETLKLERQGNVGWLINNRPQQLNAMNALMREEFASAWIELDRDPQVRVIVHTGEGPRLSDRGRRRRRSPATASAWSVTANPPGSSTCTSPRGISGWPSRSSRR